MSEPRTDEGTIQALAEIAALSWKLCEAFERELGFAAADRAQSGAATLRFARRRLEMLLATQALRIATYEGEVWSAQIPASPINHDEVEGAEAVVDSTIEPTVIGPAGIVLPGKILLRKA
jgi:hypothetical protein